MAACRRVSGVFTWLCGEGVCAPQVKAQIPIRMQLLVMYCVLIGLGVPFRGFGVFVSISQPPGYQAPLTLGQGGRGRLGGCDEAGVPCISPRTMLLYR